MVRFANPVGNDDAAIRAARGKHEVVFEEGDEGPALRAITPFLSWSTDADGELTLPYVEFLDLAGRPHSRRPSA